jgi:glutathione S-transferase
VAAGRDAGLAGFRASLEPLRSMLTYQRWIGGEGPLFSDYIVFGALQWVRVMSPYQVVAEDDPVAEWFGRCLDLHDGLGRSVAAAA